MYELTGAAEREAIVPITPALTHQFLNAIRRRLRLCAAIFAGVLIAAILAALLWPTSYTSEVRLIAGSRPSSQAGPPTDLPVLNALLVATGVQSGETYAELLNESPVVQGVIDRLHLATDARTLRKSVKIKPVTNTSIIGVSVTWPTAAGSAAIANEFANTFMLRERELIASQADSAIGFLRGELPGTGARLKAAESALASFQEHSGIADINAQTQSVVSSLAAIDSKIGAVQLDARQATAQLGSLQRTISTTAPAMSGGGTVAPNPVRTQIEGQLAQINAQLGTMRQQYTDRYPGVQALLLQQRTLQGQLAGIPATVVSASNTVPNPMYGQLTQQAAALRAQSSADTSQLIELAKQRASLEPVLKNLPMQTLKLTQLQRQAKLAEGVYTALQQKLNDAILSKTTAISDVTVTQPANPADAVKLPNRALLVIAGLILGLLLALSAALTLEYLDNRVRDEDEAVRLFELPVLASIPQLGEAGRPALPYVASVAVEALLHLVTSLRYASDHPLRSLAITSAMQGEGKSTIALSVARALCEVYGPTLLVDADMRRPSLQKLLKMNNGRGGLSDILAGHGSLQGLVRSTRWAGLDFLPSGVAAPNPVKLLNSERFDKLLAEATGKYAMVVFDLPAVVPVVDAAVVAEKADGTALIVSIEKSDKRHVRDAIERLRRLGCNNLLGMVMNRTSPGAHEADGYYTSDVATLAFELPVLTK